LLTLFQHLTVEIEMQGDSNPVRHRARGKGKSIGGAAGALLIAFLLVALFIFTRNDRFDVASRADGTAPATPGSSANSDQNQRPASDLLTQMPGG
jgi:hypothetical protein